MNSNNASNYFPNLTSTNIPEPDLTFSSDLSSDLLARGLFGEVSKAKQLGRDVAVKTLYKKEKEGEEHKKLSETKLAAFEREISLAKPLQHPCIVSTFGFTIKNMKLYLVMELMEGGDLEDCLEHPDFQALGIRRFSVLRDILSGLIYLNQMNIVHNDLRPANVFLDKHLRTKIGDFGLANITPKEYTDFFATRKWRNPDPISSHKADIYSFGLIIWAIANARCMKESDTGLSRPALPLPRTPYSITKMAVSCWQLNPADRPTARELLEATPDNLFKTKLA